MSDVADIVRIAARKLVKADGATFVLLEGDQVYYADEDAIGPLWKGQRFDKNGCISGLAILSKEQVVIEDIFADDRVPHEYYRPTFVKSMAMTPVRKADPVAAIGTYWQKTYHPTRQECVILQILADSASLAIETVTVLETLEARVQERTKELEDSRDRAIELSQIKSTFVSNVSHDLRTPLSGLVSVAELLSDTPLDGEQKQLMEILQSSAASLLQLLNDVLDLTKIEAGRIDLESIPVNLMYIVQDVSRTMSVSAFAKHLALKVNLDYRLPELVLSDSLRLRQILANLIGNAIKFTDFGDVIIGADLVSEIDNKVIIKFSVIDTGIGMSNEQMGNLFVPFVQTDRSISRRFGGTGLGLAITKQLVELMKGTITVSSEVAYGSTFEVTMPFEKVAAVALKAVKEEKASTQSIEGVKVLLAEDNIAMQRLTLTQLQRLGAETIIASNGKEALDALRKQNFDIVVMDCNMPVMNGFDASKQIRQDEEGTGKHIPIVALTAAAMTSDVQRCFDSGMDAHVPKPISMPKLQSTIYNLVNNPNPKPQAPTS